MNDNEFDAEEVDTSSKELDVEPELRNASFLRKCFEIADLYDRIADDGDDLIAFDKAICEEIDASDPEL